MAEYAVLGLAMALTVVLAMALSYRAGVRDGRNQAVDQLRFAANVRRVVNTREHDLHAALLDEQADRLARKNG